MKKFVVTWTFMRHIHRHREYKILTKIIDADSQYLAEFKMRHDLETHDLYKKGYSEKLQAYTCIDNYLNKEKMSLFGQIEQLEQLKTATWDGDLISKSERDELVNQGLVVRHEGWNIISTSGLAALIKLHRLKK